MKIASWNVNSLKVRLPHLTQWLADAQPDIVALQETKLEDAKFPVDELAAAGYRAVYSGQKTYNGVAILARDEVDLVHVEGFYLMQHVPDWVHVPVLLVEQNVARPRAPANVDAGRPAQGPRRVRRFRTSTHDRGGVLVASHADRGCDSEGPRHDPGGAAGVRRRADPRRRRPRPASAGARGEPTERAT